MVKYVKVLTVMMVALVLVGPVFAAEPAEDAGDQEAVEASGFSLNLGAAFGAGLVILGAGAGIARIGSAAVESMARQPEVAANIQTAMIISAALIEGATFFALIVCMLFN